ncbi:MAG: MoxR family ATPase [Ilumatobacteraceae bacterium]
MARSPASSSPPTCCPPTSSARAIYRPSREQFDVEPGPVFANVVLADEINRASPKVQSALLEVMAERQVSIGGTTFAVPRPFMVMATQNPIESEGVYPLPEAQRDRFLMKVLVDYPSDREEAEIVRRISVDPPVAQRTLTPDEWAGLQQGAAQIFVHDAVVDYAVRLVAATRRPAEANLPELAPYISYGVSPRATLALVGASRALAMMRRRAYVLPRDVFDVAPDILRHRLVLSYEALAADVTADHIVARVLSTVWAPQIAPSQHDDTAAVNVTIPANPAAGADPTLNMGGVR